MGRNKGPKIRVVSIRLLETTVAQLEAEARAADKLLSVYLKDLLQAYAPGVPTTDVHALAARLSRTARELGI